MERLYSWASGVYTLCDPSLAPLARQTDDLVVRIKPISRHRIVVEWAEPRGKHSLLTLRLREFHSHASVLHEPPRGRQRIVLGNLKPRTTYTIQVHNRDLMSKYFSDPMYARTWPSRSPRAKRQEFVLRMMHGSYFVSPYHLPGDPDAALSLAGSASSSRSGNNDSPVSPSYSPQPNTSGYSSINDTINNNDDSINNNDDSINNNNDSINNNNDSVDNNNDSVDNNDSIDHNRDSIDHNRDSIDHNRDSIDYNIDEESDIVPNEDRTEPLLRQRQAVFYVSL